MSVECGQVLWLRARFNNSSKDVSPVAHPYPVLRKDEETRTVEVGQLDTHDDGNYTNMIMKAWLKKSTIVGQT